MRTRTGGFTLLEAVVVVAILSVLVAALPLSFNRSIASRRVMSISRELVARIAAAQVRSALSDRVIELELTESGALETPTDADFEAVRDSGEAIENSGPAIRMTDRLGRNQDRLSFSPDGSSNGARIEVVDQDRAAIIVVSGLTGRIRMERFRVSDAP